LPSPEKYCPCIRSFIYWRLANKFSLLAFHILAFGRGQVSPLLCTHRQGKNLWNRFLVQDQCIDMFQMFQL
jgi:hypothetical protein